MTYIKLNCSSDYGIKDYAVKYISLDDVIYVDLWKDGDVFINYRGQGRSDIALDPVEGAKFLTAWKEHNKIIGE